MSDELHDKWKTFLVALAGMEHGSAITIGSYVNALLAKNQMLEKENKQLEERIQHLEGKLWNANEDARVFQLRALTSEKKNQCYKQAIEESLEIAKGNVLSSPACSDIEVILNQALQGGNKHV